MCLLVRRFVLNHVSLTACFPFSDSGHKRSEVHSPSMVRKLYSDFRLYYPIYRSKLNKHLFLWSLTKTSSQNFLTCHVSILSDVGAYTSFPVLTFPVSAFSCWALLVFAVFAQSIWTWEGRCCPEIENNTGGPSTGSPHEPVHVQKNI